ncbi:MAG: hypothetical protein IT363_14435 [Methanoregulaceae archaeon]|nr:hypothetical protein [Methanoregulaceae archaeon]
MDLSLLFDYDLWATRRWLSAIAGLRDLARAHEILEHMLMAQRSWLNRLGVEVPPQEGDVQLGVLFTTLSGLWKYVVEEGDLDGVVEYQNSEGTRFRNTVREIAMHVVNHGTYHRGQLRGLAESEGFEGFPDTDLIFFLREPIE